ncbi:MAG: hypothetical protein ACRELF_13360 [Gemmataceae bacterium]
MGEFDHRKAESAYWANKANDLHLAAAVLWKCISADSSDDVKTKLPLDCSGRLDIALPSVYLMLCGMSIELLLKTTIVAKGDEPENTHLLDKLAAEAGVVYSAEQVALLQILSGAIIWKGKYPVPKEEKHWNRLAQLETNCLFDKTPWPGTTLFILTRNGALDWNSYTELRGIAFDAMSKAVDWLHEE